MIFGLSIDAFTQFHVILSLVGIASGLVVLFGLWTGQRMSGWTALFLATTILTSATGFLFHSKAFGPPHAVGAISIAVLLAAVAARYGWELQGAWRGTYVVCSVLALYLNAFVGVVQAFLKIPALHALAPNGNEAPFAVTQLLVLAAFVAAGVVAFRRFRPS